MSSKHSGRKQIRKRGVRASRQKLIKAMTEAGFKTQAAVADHIAKTERLECGPKDMINRAFRELPVEPSSIERIARVFNVQSYQLYLTAQDQNTGERKAGVFFGLRLNIPSVPKRWLMFAVPMVVAGVVLLFVYSKAGKSWYDFKPKLGLYNFIVYAGSRDDVSQNVAKAVQANLGRLYPTVYVADALLREPSEPDEIARQYQADSVLSVSSERWGRHVGLAFALYAADERRVIFRVQLTELEIRQQRDELAARLVSRVQEAFALVDQPLATPVSAAAQQHYLQGRDLLDHDYDFDNLKQAQQHFSSASELHSGFALAYAGICEALILQSWQGDEKALLEQASQACDQAFMLDAQHVYVLNAQAHLFRRSGRAEQALQQYRDTLQLWPNNSDALFGVAFSLYNLFQQGDAEKAAIASAVDHARQAVALEPGFWRYQHYLGAIAFAQGDLAAAVDASEAAVQSDENSLSLVNLGTLRFCQGETEAAYQHYQRIRELSPDSYFTDEFMGMLYYYMGEFEQAMKLRSQSLQSIKEEAAVHQMWGNLGDAQRQAGYDKAAIKAYKTAIKIVDRDTLRGNLSVGDELARIYYNTQLHRLQPQHHSATNVPTVISRVRQLTEQAAEPQAYLKLAQIYTLWRQPEQARQTLAKAVKRCPGYAKLPDLNGKV